LPSNSTNNETKDGNVEFREHFLDAHPEAKEAIRRGVENGSVVIEPSSKLVLWCVYSSPDWNLRNSTAQTQLVTASENGLRFPDEESAEKNLFQKLPVRVNSLDESTASTTFWYDIKGGNHAGFANYGSQTFLIVDGNRTISLEDQHQQMVQVVSRFILGDRSIDSL
jgi:hypothetical protein